MKKYIAAALIGLLALHPLAAGAVGLTAIQDMNTQGNTLKVNSDGSINVNSTGGGGGGTVTPTNSSGSMSAVTVGTSSSTAISAAACKVYCAIYNNSQTATICINLNGAATITGTVCAAGEISLPPLWHQSWEGFFVPSDAVTVIASAASTPATTGAK